MPEYSEINTTDEAHIKKIQQQIQGKDITFVTLEKVSASSQSSEPAFLPNGGQPAQSSGITHADVAACSKKWTKYAWRPKEHGPLAYWWYCESDGTHFEELNPWPWQQFRDPTTGNAFWWRDDATWFWQNSGSADSAASGGAEGDGTLDFKLYSEAGPYILSVFSDERTVSEQKGGYTFDRRSGRIQDDAGNCCGCFSIQGMPLSFAIPEEGGTKPLKCISVTNSEIMVEIQKPTNNNAFFVLPSQLNGAEYQSFERDFIVKDIDDYQWDNTGGPRGQLAVHPAAGQFVLDNAANDIHPDGISAVTNVIKEVTDKGCDFELQNGYLRVPCGGASKAIEAWKRALKKFKMMVMEDVPASGLTPDKAGFSAATHRVNLVYASAVPVQAYNNAYGDRGMQIQVAAATLVAQYYGALSIAARRGTPTSPKVVYLMPLGGGVFENPPEIIVKGMSLAVEMLSQEEMECLDVRILTFHRNAAEVQEFTRILGVFQKLNDSAT